METFISLFQNFNVVDAIDIALVAVILYRFFAIIQGTRAVQVLMGLITFVSIYWLSLSFELYALNWVLKSFIDYFFIIAVILFQEQIRTALAVFGEAGFIGRKKQGHYDEQIEEVVTACSALSRERTGALIVFERKHGLLNYAMTGTRLDSRVHSDIIYTLFQSNTPIHDGAVIIYQNRIQAAGCFLPLSKNIELDRHYGTRHRAALGISEVSDAVVVIVSEERGKISICSNGRFYECETETALRHQLRSHLYASKFIGSRKHERRYSA